MAVAERPDSGGPAPGSPLVNPADADATRTDPAAAAALARAADELGRLTDREPSAGLVPAVMHSVWAELRPGQLIVLPGSDGRLLVGSTAVATAITGELDDRADVVVRRCTVQARDEGPAGSGVGPLRVALTASVAYGTDTRELSELVRTMVFQTVGELFGLDVDRVDLTIEDVFATGAGR